MKLTDALLFRWQFDTPIVCIFRPAGPSVTNLASLFTPAGIATAGGSALFSYLMSLGTVTPAMEMTSTAQAMVDKFNYINQQRLADPANFDYKGTIDQGMRDISDFQQQVAAQYSNGQITAEEANNLLSGYGNQISSNLYALDQQAVEAGVGSSLPADFGVQPLDTILKGTSIAKEGVGAGAGTAAAGAGVGAGTAAAVGGGAGAAAGTVAGTVAAPAGVPSGPPATPKPPSRPERGLSFRDILLGTAVSGATNLAGAAIGSAGASKAAEAQAEAALEAARIAGASEAEALAFAKQVWEETKAREQPFLEAGQKAVTDLSGRTGVGGDLVTPWGEKFVAPTDVTQQNDPGYQFRLNEGMKILERSAAAKGGLLTGGTAKALERYAQDYASGEYGDVYNRALGEYQQRYNISEQNQAKAFNRLAALAGLGQTTAGTLASTGTSATGQVGNIIMSSGEQRAQAAENAAAARASGYATGANLWSNALSGAGNNFSQMLLLSQLFKQNPSIRFG